MKSNRQRSACWMAGTLLGLFAAGCGQSSRDTTAMPEPPAAEAPRPPPTGVVNDKDCPLQFADPVPSMQTGTDPRLSSQWHLKNDATVAGGTGEDVRAAAAWAQTRGEKVRVAVIDDAIEVTHEDLAPNVVPDASFNYRETTFGNAWPLPCIERNLAIEEDGDEHGTAVAGLIAARDFNGIGVAGVAPRADLVGYNALWTKLSSDIADALNRDLPLNGVYNNSWGSEDDGLLHPVEPSFIRAIQDGIITGRNRKGAIYVFPGGNGGCNERQSGQLCDNSNYDGYTNKLGVITTCAVDADGLQPDYGERGANLLVCAPGSRGNSAPRAGFDGLGVTTTAIGNEYQEDFRGTSASTPIVSGVIALMLAANPELTWRDVQLILASTARQNDPEDTDPERQQGAGITGLNFSHKYGFGVADAEAAVRAAQTWTSVGGSSTLTKCGPYARQVDLPVPDSGGAGSTPQPVASAISVPPCSIGKIEFVEVKLTARHPMSGDLRVQLRSPQNLVSELADARDCKGPSSGKNPCGDYDEFAFGSVRHMNEPVRTATLSDWTLEVADLRAADSGTFERWSITFYGRP